MLIPDRPKVREGAHIGGASADRSIAVLSKKLPSKHLPAVSSQFKNSYFTEMCSGSEEGWFLRLIDFVYHSTLGLGEIKKKKKV